MEGKTEIVKKIKKLTFGVIDASSIIYMTKSGFMKTAAKAIIFHTIPEVFRETGFEVPEIRLITHNKTGPVDTLLLESAQEMNVPLISEDKKLLLKAQNNNLPYYNAVMILNALLAKQEISREQHSFYFKKLVATARYSPKVLDFSYQVFKAVD